MAFRFLKALTSALGVGQMKAIEELSSSVDEAALSIVTNEYEGDISRMVAALKDAGRYVSPYVASPPVIPDGQTVAISSKLLNTNFSGIYTALHGLFKQLILTDGTMRAHKHLLDSQLNLIMATINKTTQDLEMHSALRKPENISSGYNQIVRFDFWNARNDFQGHSLAEVDPRSRVVRLPSYARNRATKFRGSDRSKVTVTNLSYAYSTGILSKDFKPENALDESDQTFWLDVTLTDQPISTPVSLVDYTGLSSVSRTYNGVLVQYRVDLGSARSLSRAQMLPFAQFPVQLVGIEFLNGVDSTGTEEWRLVRDWTVPEAGDHATASLDWVEHHFHPVVTSAIRLTFLQPNWTRSTYLVPKSQVDNTTLWAQMLDDDLSLVGSDEELSGLAAREVQTNPRYRSLLDANRALLEDLSSVFPSPRDTDRLSNVRRQADLIAASLAKLEPEDALPVLRAIGGHSEKVFTDPTLQMVDVTKVEYQVGLSSLSLFDEVFFPDAAWSSPKYTTHSRVYSAALEATTDILSLPGYPGGTSVPVGSVEYEVEFAPDRKVNLLPEGTVSLTEVLRFGPDTKQAKLRFEPSSVTAVYKNGALVASGDYTVDTGGWTVTIDSGVLLDFNARYTALYVPAAGQDSVNVDTSWNSKQITEKFTATGDNGQLSLSFEPYVAREIVNSTADWYREDPEIAVYHYRASAGSSSIDGITYSTTANRTYEPVTVVINGTKARNVTRYAIEPGDNPRPDGTIDQPAFLDTGPSGLYSYIQQGSTIFLNQPSAAGATIEVTYRWLTQYVQVHCTLRSHRVLGRVSPVLEDVTLKMNTSNVFSKK